MSLFNDIVKMCECEYEWKTGLPNNKDYYFAKVFGGEVYPRCVRWDGSHWIDADGNICPYEVIAWMRTPKSYGIGRRF